MTITVNGLKVPVSGAIVVLVEVDPDGETVPGVVFDIRGGPLTIDGSPNGIVILTQKPMTITGH